MVILVSVTTRDISIKEIESILEKTSAKEFELKIACEKNNKLVEEFSKTKKFLFPTTLDIYPVGTVEEAMIESSVKNLPADALLLVRNDTPNFTANVIDKILNAGEIGNDVVMLKKRDKKSKIRNFFANIPNALCKIFFNFKHYDGDIGVQYFSMQAQTLLRNTNVNLMSKLNRWLALNIHYVEMDIKPTKFPKKSYKKPLIKSLSYFTALVVVIVLFIVFGGKINWTFITTLLMLFAVILPASMALFHTLDIYNVFRVGSLHVKPEDVIEIRKPKQKPTKKST